MHGQQIEQSTALPVVSDEPSPTSAAALAAGAAAAIAPEPAAEPEPVKGRSTWIT